MAALLLTSMVWSGHAQEKNEMDLSGEWAFQTDVMDFRRGSLDVRYCHRLQESIVLPGITDDYKIGYKSPYRHLDRLTRVYEYMGPAWYQREIEIPVAWKGKRIFLYFERTHWLSSVYVGKEEVSKIDYISIPHNHELTQWLHPGKKELITFCIDNRYQYDTHKWDHAHSEFTQINWNGVLGEIKLVAVDPVYVDDMQVYPDIKNKSIKVKMTVRNCTEHTASGKISFHVTGKDYRLQKEVPVTVTDSITYIEEEMFLGKDIHLWNEFHPNLYTLDCKLTSSVEGQSYAHEKSTTFGMREVEAGEDHIILNGEPIHLRGTVENAVFPKTGYAPVDDASWERVLRILKEYGMNHMRFHSWCPPAAAFRMADKLGVYLEVEMPMWGKDAQPDEKRWNFFRRELRGILKEYGNHPSFILYCNGNEITGDFSFIEELTATARQLDNRRLYSGSTARTRVKSDQFYITHQTTKGHMAIYEGRPYTNWDKNKELGVGLPIISHESGQRCIYPNFEEIKNFTGPVQARNFEIFRELLDKNHMLDQAHDFFRASGALTAIEYKDVIEAQLRTYLKGGFQLLSLNDFTGQGYAPVGILDPFWNTKGLITPEKWHEFCAPTVALLRFDKRALYNDEVFEGKAEIYNYGPTLLKNAKINWSITDSNGKTLKSGKLKTQTVGKNGVFPLGSFSYALNNITEPQKLTVHLSVAHVKNSWDIWVYPRHSNLMQSTSEVLYTTVFDEKAKQHLADGKKVVLCPKPSKVKGRKSVFHNHFWNPIMFKWPPMTIGCLIHDDQPIFEHFITSYHTDWQWWDILENAKVIEMKDAPAALRPFIQVIDHYDNNEKLGIGFEAKVKKGSLLVLAVDTQKNINERPATQQLLESIDRYVKSDKFAPQITVDESYIESFLKK